MTTQDLIDRLTLPHHLETWNKAIKSCKHLEDIGQVGDIQLTTYKSSFLFPERLIVEK